MIAVNIVAAPRRETIAVKTAQTRRERLYPADRHAVNRKEMPIPSQACAQDTRAITPTKEKCAAGESDAPTKSNVKPSEDRSSETEADRRGKEPTCYGSQHGISFPFPGISTTCFANPINSNHGILLRSQAK